MTVVLVIDVSAVSVGPEDLLVPTSDEKEQKRINHIRFNANETLVLSWGLKDNVIFF